MLVERIVLTEIKIVIIIIIIFGQPKFPWLLNWNHCQWETCCIVTISNVCQYCPWSLACPKIPQKKT